MAPKFALFTKGSNLPLNKVSKICLSYYSLALNPRHVPAAPYLTPASTRIRATHSKKLRQFPARTDTFKFSFFHRTIPVWNSLSAPIAKVPDLVHFKQELSSLINILTW